MNPDQTKKQRILSSRFTVLVTAIAGGSAAAFSISGGSLEALGLGAPLLAKLVPAFFGGFAVFYFIRRLD